MARIRIKRKNDAPYWSIHTHSRYSAKDALPSVKELVQEAVRHGYPALAMTDHGNISASVQLYRECKAAGIKPLPGSEFYLVHDRSDKKAKRYHFGLVAYTTAGYRNLVHISSMSHRNFHHKPLVDFADLARLHEEGRTDGLALTTGCYFGIVIQTLINDGYEAAKSVVASFASWFDTYVEIQRHCIKQEPMGEKMIAAMLSMIAEELDLPVVIAQDSHYTHQEDKEDHDALKRLVSFGPDVDDGIFPGDSFHLADEAWMRAHHSETIYNKGVAGLKRILDRYDMHIEEMEEYNYRVPTRYDNPESELRKRVSKALMDRDLNVKRYYEGMQEELDVVEVARMAGYLLLVAEVCDYMRSQGIFYQIRGSAAGSLLCYLLGITDIDPLKWKLRFDRFLTKDRTKPPDIDIDVDSERRGELIEWIDDNYSVTQICTFGTYSITEDAEGDSGSLKVAYLSRQRQTGQEPSWGNLATEDLNMLYRLSERELVSGYGVHAAGLVVCADRAELEKYIPTMYVASSKTTVSQYDMDDVESIGAVKLDVLGVKTLSVIRRTLELVGKDMKDGLDFIPLNDSKTYRRIASGDTAGVFQLEGGSSSRGVRTLKPRKIADVIAAMALFRPGVMMSGATDSYMARRDKREELPERHKLIMSSTKETMGILLYQDQVIEILRNLGMNTDDLNVFLKAVKASNKGVDEAQRVMTEYEPVVDDLCEKAGMDEVDKEWLWQALKAFADYSFNRSHSTVYGLTAYRCAWLLNKYPVEYHAAMLSVYSSDSKKETLYTRVARSRGIRMLRPDIQISGTGYTPDTRRNGVARGLDSIKGVGTATAQSIITSREENGGSFKDLDDFVTKVNPSKVSGVKPYLAKGDMTVGTLGKLVEAGALESIGVSRP